LGFAVRFGKGDYVVLQRGQMVFSVPLHKTIKKGTLTKIIRQAGISAGEFNEAL